ncbi:hypothetical protein GCM10009867_24030 [Pedococcus aerophilus]|uniref:Copper-containing nitrite reductase n=1 Tax=Pedococcus aerophilus TaxID=436356 RepID=A0ABN3URR1_9MICO
MPSEHSAAEELDPHTGETGAGPTGLGAALRRHLRLWVAGVVALALVGTIGWMWAASLVPASYSPMQMGLMDAGGGPAVHLGMAHGTVPSGATGSGAGPRTESGVGPRPRDVTSFVEQRRGTPDVRLTLTARREEVSIPGGPTVTAYTLNGTTPGPTIRAAQGQLVEVTLVNESVPGGTTLHWHGIDVPNAEDGVAGVTQDAVTMGRSHTYRFVAERAGTYWYHSHQVSHEQVVKGLLGAVVVTPKAPDAWTGADTALVALSHVYAGKRTINGRAGETRIEAAAGSVVRVRVVNTDNGLMPVWVGGAAFRVLAVDGTEVHEPQEATGRAVLVPAGGRADLGVHVPATGVRVELPGAALVLGPAGAQTPAPTRKPAASVDLLSYGTPVALPFDPERATRHFTYSIGRRPGFVNGRPGVHWTINGTMYPKVPMFVVSEGDVVRVRIANKSGETHPMHLHGHHVVVLSRDGVAATGSPWWTDSLEVSQGQTVEVAFVADNPGIWMDHCHNLPHAKEGLVAHLMYEGVTTPFRLGRHSVNSPE